MSRSRFSTFLELSINTPSTRVTSGKRSVSGSFAQMLDEDVRRVGVSGPMTVTTASEHAELVTFVDRVIVPALVEKFLRDHGAQTPAGDPLAKTKDAA